MKKYEVVKEIEHDGQRIAPGTEIELSDSLAAYLLPRGDIKANEAEIEPASAEKPVKK